MVPTYRLFSAEWPQHNITYNPELHSRYESYTSTHSPNYRSNSPMLSLSMRSIVLLTFCRFSMDEKWESAISSSQKLTHVLIRVVILWRSSGQSRFKLIIIQLSKSPDRSKINQYLQRDIWVSYHLKRWLLQYFRSFNLFSQKHGRTPSARFTVAEV